ncbi:MAG: HAD family phosphatase [Reyranella sp.]|uniref:HAD family hydrolase n=1 Tax=Reyranella sp. TaxID=1929291 RepID=UPI0011FA2ECC|nr:HAD family phosphatase [Reyranella sp.]TAJ39087.1 MAG: HAD family phosphatase [Reyranella sp.]
MLRKPIEAALFDMDGLLLDTEALYIQAMQTAARRLDLDMPLALCHAMVGVPGRECNLMIQAFYGEGFSIETFRGHFSTNIRELLDERIPVKAGAIELLDFLEARGVPCAVATSAGRTTAEHHLARAGLLGRFQALATRDDVTHAKPEPDVYLEAARRLGVAPERCIAFEDSNVGLTAAHAAGTMAFFVPDIVAPHPEVRSKAVRVLGDLHEALKLLRGEL